MKQTLHIFAKDTRRFLPEILISLAITAVFACLYPYQWPGGNDPHSYMWMGLLSLLASLVPVSWWILIARVIHAERLVGDTQFWITRPYEWKNLLAAKLLFLAAFLYLPFFLAQSLLLAEAGFHPQSYLAGLFFNLLFATAFVVLPLSALAAVTSTFARMTLTLLGILLGFVLIVAVAGLIFAHSGPTMKGDLGNLPCFVLAVLGCCAVIGLQYALRRTWLSRLILIALPILLLAVSFIADGYFQAHIDRIYPPSAAQDGPLIQLSYSPNLERSGSTTIQVTRNAMIPVSIPLTESGVAEGTVVVPEGIRAEITAPDGSHWTSAWQLFFQGYRFLPGEARPSATFSMPMAVFSKFQSMPLRVHLTFALIQGQAGRVTTIPLPASRFSVPDFGVCAPQRGWGPQFGEIAGIGCLFPLREPQLTYISTRWSNASCPASPSEPDLGVTGVAWVGSFDREPAQFGISSVVQPPISLSNNILPNRGNQEVQFRNLCLGTPITFTQYNLVRRTQTSVAIEGFFLPKMTAAGNAVTITQ
jgi:hypothetical protein